MAVYTLRHTDTTKDPIVIYPKSLDGPGANRRNTDLRLYGQGAELWGEGVDENLLRLLENFASPESSPGEPDPTILATPNEGQIWFNTTDKHVYVYKAEGSPSQWESFAGVSDVYLKAESDARYYERSLADDKFVDEAGDTMTGTLVLDGQRSRVLSVVDSGSPALGGQILYLESAPFGTPDGVSSPPVVMFYNPDNDPNTPGALAGNNYPYTKITVRDNQILTLETSAIETYGGSGGSPPVSYEIFTMKQDGEFTYRGIAEDPTATPVGLAGLGEMRAPYTNVAHSDSLTTKDYVDNTVGSAIPSGAIMSYAGSGSAPSGWMYCRGGAISRTTYSDLFGAIGTQYGVGDGSTTFNIPDLRGRTLLGMDMSVGRVTNAAADTLGGSLGAENHTLTTAQMPQHNHNASTNTQGGHSHGLKISTKGVDGDGGQEWLFRSQAAADRTGWMDSQGSHSHTVTINNTGSSSAHNNMQPTMALNWIIKT